VPRSLSLALLCVALHDTHAQHANASVCVRDRQPPACRTVVFITVAGYARVVGTNSHALYAADSPFGPTVLRQPLLPSHGALAVGVLRNRADGVAIGGDTEVGLGSNLWRVALHGRYRRWLLDSVSLHVAPGILTAKIPYEADFGTESNRRWRWGATLDAELYYHHAAAASVRVDVVPTRRSGTATSVFGGLKLADRLGIGAAYGALGIGIIALVLGAAL